MWDIHMRILAEAEYIVKTNSTVRATANHFKISKSTVHTEVTKPNGSSG
ncbi:MAG: sporulation transcriptional regulator SpoIIID [Candidatus Coproplasma sp.]